MIVYGVVNKTNNKMYVGQTSRALSIRKKAHLSNQRDTALCRAFRKYGDDSFDWFVIKECCNSDEMNYWEDFYIRLFLSSKGLGYNMRLGGAKGMITDETRRKMSLAMSGHPVSEETKAKISLANKGHHHSEGTKKKISLVNKGKPSPRKGVVLPPELKKKMSLAKLKNPVKYWSGKKHTPEAKLKMSESAKKRPPMADETRDKLKKRQTFLGHHHSEESRLKMSESAKRRPPITEATRLKLSDIQKKRWQKRK